MTILNIRTLRMEPGTSWTHASEKTARSPHRGGRSKTEGKKPRKVVDKRRNMVKFSLKFDGWKMKSPKMMNTGLFSWTFIVSFREDIYQIPQIKSGASFF